MALIIYPDPLADSFVTVAEADVYISQLTVDNDKWVAQTPERKEQLLRIAYRYIFDNTDESLYGIPFKPCLGEAQALMASHDLVNSLSGGGTTQVTGALKKQKAGPVEREFYDTSKVTKSRTRVPDLAKACLESVGYHTPSAGQTRLGRS